jgi:hypothetical protein
MPGAKQQQNYCDPDRKPIHSLSPFLIEIRRAKGPCRVPAYFPSGFSFSLKCKGAADALQEKARTRKPPFG